MARQQQQPSQDYEYYATQLMAEGEEPSPLSSVNLAKLATINPIEISYQPRIRRDRRTIIHDITSLTRRTKPSTHSAETPPPRRTRRHGEESRRERSPGQSERGAVQLEALPAPRAQLQLMRSEMKESHEQNEDYLRHNLGTVKEKIRSKFMRHRVDFADSSHPHPPKQLRSEPRESTQRRLRIGRYNHDFEEYLIRKRIGKKGGEHREGVEAGHLEEELAARPEEKAMRVDTRRAKGREPQPLYYSSDCEGPRLIIVSPMHPVHALTKFKNFVIETASRSCSREDGEELLKRYVDRNFGKGARSYEKQRSGEGQEGEGEEGRGELAGVSIKKLPAANFVKSPLNYTLFKKQIHKLRKESIGLPLLLEAQDEPTAGALLEERINARKISCLFTLPQEEARPSPKKYVVYSRKNLGGGAGPAGDSS